MKNRFEFRKGSKPYLFVKLANPDENGQSRWVSKEEFVGEYSSLMFQNGADWCRKESTIAKYYYIEFDKSITPGNGVDRIRLNGYKKEEDRIGSQTIRADIKNYYKKKRCVILYTSNPEVDHKNGWKNDTAMNIKTQRLEDFQPLSKAANDAKRQFCKECRKTNKRFDAKNIGHPISYYKGTENHEGDENGCIGCFWYDPIEFRKNLTKKSN